MRVIPTIHEILRDLKAPMPTIEYSLDDDGRRASATLEQSLNRDCEPIVVLHEEDFIGGADKSWVLMRLLYKVSQSLASIIRVYREIIGDQDFEVQRLNAKIKKDEHWKESAEIQIRKLESKLDITHKANERWREKYGLLEKQLDGLRHYTLPNGEQYDLTDDIQVKLLLSIAQAKSKPADVKNLEDYILELAAKRVAAFRSGDNDTYHDLSAKMDSAVQRLERVRAKYKAT